MLTIVSGGEKMGGVPDLYPLISLQIGDAQSYLSRAYLFFAIASYKFLILVDNHSWRMNNNHSTTIHLRELFATKYRTSPFKNTRALTRLVSARYKDTSITSNDERKKLHRWASTVNSRRATPLMSLMDLHVALHGFIVFEVSWEEIRGINYFNILQMDTSMAFEVKSMRKWDFNSVHQASNCILSWFSGTPSETRELWRCLMFLDNKLPTHNPSSSNNDNIAPSSNNEPLSEADDKTPQVKSPPNEENFFNVQKCNHHDSDLCCRLNGDACCHLDERQLEQKITNQQRVHIESMEYKDTLLKFYFNNKDLPFIFKDIITSDLRLLTLLESGLPSWVIFLQSYPLFCKVYRHWMRPLVRTLYITISLITCTIGFYDLYKNVPLMKAFVSHICGPLFSWIEDWDMISRIQYIGTMLFLQNFEKAMRFSLKIGRVLKLTLFLITKPLIEPLQDLLEFTSPLWVFIYEIGVEIYQVVSSVLFFVFNLFFGLFRALFSPFMLLYKYIVSIVVLFRPIFMHLWALCMVPLKACSALGNHVAIFFTNIYKVLQGILMIIVSKLTFFTRLGSRLARAPKPKTSDVSMLNTLGKDLLSKMIRSLRSIMYGLVACLDTIVRHRHSARTHLREYLRRLSYRLSSRVESPQQPLLPKGSQKENAASREHVD